MTLHEQVMRRAVLLGAFALITSVGAAQIRPLTLVVVNRDENTVAFLDPATGRILGRVAVGEQPHGLAVSDDGRLAFVTNTLTTRSEGKLVSPSISVIDIAAQKELRRVNTGPFSRPHGITYAGGKVYFTAEGYRLVGCYDPATNQIEWMLGNGQERTTLILANKDRDQARLQGTSVPTPSPSWTLSPDPAKWTVRVNWSLTTIPVGDGPHGVDLSPDGKEIWTANEFDNTVSIIDVATKKVTQTLKVSTKASARLAFTPDGKRVFICDDLGLLVLDAVTRKELKRVKLGTPTHEEIPVLAGRCACLHSQHRHDQRSRHEDAGGDGPPHQWQASRRDGLVSSEPEHPLKASSNGSYALALASWPSQWPFRHAPPHAIDGVQP